MQGDQDYFPHSVKSLWPQQTLLGNQCSTLQHAYYLRNGELINSTIFCISNAFILPISHPWPRRILVPVVWIVRAESSHLAFRYWAFADSCLNWPYHASTLWIEVSNPLPSASAVWREIVEDAFKCWWVLSAGVAGIRDELSSLKYVHSINSENSLGFPNWTEHISH